MELRQLRYFLRVAEFKSFSRAATAVRVAQPALSRQVRRLEEEIGVSLFYRDGRGALLTEQGKLYCQRITDILQQLDQAATDLNTDDDLPTGEVILGIPAQLGPRFVSQIVHSFRSHYPGARIRVADGCNFQIAEWLQSSRIDAGFIYDPQAYQNLGTKLMVEELLYLVGPELDEYTSKKVVPFRQVAKLPLIMPNLGGTLRQRVTAAAAQLGIIANYEIDVDSLPAIKQLVLDGAGYTILPYAAVYDEIKRGSLTAARIIEPDLLRPLGYAVRPKGTLSVVTNKLSSLIQLEIGNLLTAGNWMGHAVAENTLKSAVMATRGPEAEAH